LICDIFLPKAVYEKKHTNDRTETSIVEDLVCAIREERDSFFEDRTDAQNCCRLDNKCLVFGESVFDTIILEHHRYFSSEEIHCEGCLRMEQKKRKGETETVYYHDVVAAAGVRPGDPVVVPLAPKFIRNEDGAEKQDGERNAAKRWIRKNQGKYGPLQVTLLGDDLYACHPICAAIPEGGMCFLVTCRPESHPWIMEQVKYSEACTHEKRTWNGRNHLIYRYR
jgi:hypothetical protein